MGSCSCTKCYQHDSSAVDIVIICLFIFFFIRISVRVIQTGDLSLREQVARAVLLAQSLHIILDDLAHIAAWNQDCGAKNEA